MICVYIDELTPCLKNAETNELVPTIAKRIKDKKQLAKFKETGGWFVDWDILYLNNEIYALYVTGIDTVQGLVALYPNEDANAVYITWMCAAPHNQRNPKQYIGVGGHLFAIAIERAFHYGLKGEIYGFAANQELLEHYEKVFEATPLGILHPYHFCITEDKSRKIIEVYDYDYESSPAKS